MSQDEQQLSENDNPIDDDMPRAVAVRHAIMAMNDMGKMAQYLPAALAGRSEEWVRDMARVIRRAHKEIHEMMDKSKKQDAIEWYNAYGEHFDVSVQRGVIPGVDMMARHRPSMQINGTDSPTSV